jgi:hypothetical protein
MVEKTGREAVVREIKRRTRKKYSSEEKIRIVLKGLRGEMSIAELCREEGLPAGRQGSMRMCTTSGAMHFSLSNAERRALLSIYMIWESANWRKNLEISAYVGMAAPHVSAFNSPNAHFSIFESWHRAYSFVLYVVARKENLTTLWMPHEEQ